MKPNLLAPDQALANRPGDYSDPELAVYTDEMAQDILDEIIAYMPVVLPVMAVLQIFMFAAVAVWLS